MHRLKLTGPGLSALIVICGHAQSPPETIETGGDKVPQGLILVKGAWSSTSDADTPLPETGRVTGEAYDNAYFRLSLPLSGQWSQRYSGPPPSDSGYYVLAQLEPIEARNVSMSAHVLIAAQDLFFSLLPAGDALEQINYSNAHLSPHYRVERAPHQVRIAQHAFVRFDYTAPVAGLHWTVLATQVRCHVVQFVFTSRDAQRLDNLVASMNLMQLPREAGVTAGEGGGDVPVCIKDYATSAQRIAGENAILTDQRFNPIPVRIVIDTSGRVKHIHFLSAFAGQTNAIREALSSWRFKPYLVDGKEVEVETGVMFGRAPRAPAASVVSAATAN